jgi:uncharacterized protein YggE
MNILEDKRVRNLIIAVLVLLAVFLLVQSIAALAGIKEKRNMMPSNVITVRGTGEAIGTPDIATFSFTARENNTDVAAAQKTMTDKINRAIDYLKEQGIEEKDIKTESYYTNPTYRYSNAGQVLTGYEVSETVSVKVRDVAKAGELLTAIAGFQIGEVSSLSFTIDDPENLKAEAKKQAIEKAEAEAKQIAEALGVDLERVVGFYEEYPQYPMPYGGEMDASISSVRAQAASPAPQLPTGEQKVTAHVSVTYEIED